MTASTSVIPADATITIHVPGGQDFTILWADVVTDILAEAVACSRLVLPRANIPETPEFNFGGDWGIYSPGPDDIRIAMSGSLAYTIQAESFSGALGGALLNEAPTAINPTVVPILADPDTGIGGIANALANISGGVAGVIFKSDGTDIIQQVEANVGLTAHTDSGQGDGPITSSYNVYLTVAVAGDAATLPAVFGIGDLVFVKNDAAANSMDVFPASGDDLSEGTDTVLAVAAGDFELFMGVVANATWTRLMAGSA